MEPAAHFRHCPACGAPRTTTAGEKPFRCGACGFTYFFNAATAVAAFLRREDGRILLTRRSRDPAKGLLTPPGGFVDLGERVEDALAREVREEVGLEMADVEFLCSFPNQYPYRDVVYPTADLFFTAVALRAETIRALDGVEDWCWLDPIREVDPGQLAFASVKAAFRELQRRRGR